MTSKAKLVDGFWIAIDDGRTHSTCVDIQPDLGTDRGPSALELAVMSFAGCVATIFVLMAKKTRVKINDLEVNVRAEKSEKLKTIAKTNYVVIVRSSENEDRLKRVFDLTRVNCPVGILFEKAGVEISFKLRILK